MKIIFYKNTSEMNKVDKTDSLELILELDGTLRQSASIINPSILISMDSLYDNVIDTNENKIVETQNNNVIIENELLLFNANYCYIQDFNRYYFINNITSVIKNLWQIDMSVDVLMSYKNKLLNLYAFVSRNEMEFDISIKDDFVSYYYDKDISEFEVQNVTTGSHVNTTFSTGQHGYNILLSCISYNTIPAAWDIEAPVSDLPTIEPIYYTDQYSTTAYILQHWQVDTITYNAILHSDTVGSFIKSLIAYPFELIPNQTDPTHFPKVVIGNTIIKDIQGVDLIAPYSKYRLSPYLVVADFYVQQTSNFLNYEPYSMYELFVPYCSWITLESNKILGKRIIVYYSISYDDGSANAYVYNYTDSMLLWTGACEIGVKIGISTTNNEQLTAQKQANNLNMTLGIISSAASTGLGVASLNPVATVGGVMSGAKTIGSYINNNSLLFDRAQATFTSGQSGMYFSQKVRMRITRYKTNNYTHDFAKLYGKPLNKVKQLSTLTGFTQVAECHIEGMDSATSSEIEKMYSLLKDGIII